MRLKSTCLSENIERERLCEKAGINEQRNVSYRTVLAARSSRSSEFNPFTPK
jgi:hypothetical protein